MVRLLSIDFDYFIDTDLDTRENKFPDGADNIPKDKLSELWNYFYDRYPEIKYIGVIEPQFEMVKEFINKHKYKWFTFAESHGYIGTLFEELDKYSELEVIHIDFHHDNYISGGEKVDCANWVRCLVDRRSNMNLDTKIRWIRREDSETSSLIGEFPYENTTKLDLEGIKFDYLFLCFSPEWTPPHLRYKYKELVDCVSK